MGKVYETATVLGVLGSYATFDAFIEGKGDLSPSDCLINSKKLLDLGFPQEVVRGLKNAEDQFSIDYWAGDDNFNNKGAYKKDPVVKKWLETGEEPVLVKDTFNFKNYLGEEWDLENVRHIKGLAESLSNYCFHYPKVFKRGNVISIQVTNTSFEYSKKEGWERNFIFDLIKEEIISHPYWLYLHSYQFQPEKGIMEINGSAFKFNKNIYKDMGFIVPTGIIKIAALPEHLTPKTIHRALLNLFSFAAKLHRKKFVVPKATELIIEYLFTKKNEELKNISFLCNNFESFNEDKSTLKQIICSLPLEGERPAIETLVGFNVLNRDDESLYFYHIGEHDKKIKTTKKEFKKLVEENTNYSPLCIDYYSQEIIRFILKGEKRDISSFKKYILF